MNKREYIMPPRSSDKPNKTTSLRNDAIVMAAENAGNKIGSDGMVSYLEAQVNENLSLFMALLGKVLSMQIVDERL